MLSELRRLAEIVDPPPLPSPVSRDSEDDAVLALAVASQADLIISGDADLLPSARMPGFPSSTPPPPSPVSAEGRKRGRALARLVRREVTLAAEPCIGPAFAGRGGSGRRKNRIQVGSESAKKRGRIGLQGTPK